MFLWCYFSSHLLIYLGPFSFFLKGFVNLLHYSFSFCIIYFGSNIYYFFPSAGFRLICCSFPSSIRCDVWFRFFLLLEVGLYCYIPLRGCFGLLCFHLHLFACVVLVCFFFDFPVCPLFCSMLFNLHVFVLLPGFFLFWLLVS